MSGPLAWITGSGGLIGHYVARCADACAPEWEIVALSRESLDLEDFGAVTRAFAVQRPSLVIHCAALSRSGVCQANPALAEKLNVTVARRLCALAEDIPLVLLSTDLVFDGRKGNYVETDAINPLSVYAETKARAEQEVLRNPRHWVIRVSLNAGASPTGDRSFTEETRRAWERGETLKLFTDEFRCPLPAAITARAVWDLVERGRPGLYHLAGSERLSRWEIGQLLAKRWPHLRAKMEPASIRDYPGPPRSSDTSLNCAKVQALLPFSLPGLSQWLRANPDEPI